MFSVVTDSQFQLPQIFISQIDRGSTALSTEMGVSKTRGRDRVGLYLFPKECCFRVMVTVRSSLTLTLTLKQHSLKKEIDPDPGPRPTPRFTDTPKLMVAIILI